MKPKTKKIVGYTLLVSLAIGTAAGLYIYKEYNRRNKDTSLLKTAFKLPAADLIREFEKDDSLAGHKYMDKVIEVNGAVKEISKDEKGYLTIVLGDKNNSSSVRCSVDSAHNNEFLQFKQGDPAAVKGICSGFNKDELLGSDAILVRCVIADYKK